MQDVVEKILNCFDDYSKLTGSEIVSKTKLNEKDVEAGLEYLRRIGKLKLANPRIIDTRNGQRFFDEYHIKS